MLSIVAKIVDLACDSCPDKWNLNTLGNRQAFIRSAYLAKDRFGGYPKHRVFQ